MARTGRWRRSGDGEALRLHIGSGSKRIDGWINIDRQKLPGVDEELDVTNGLPFTDVEAIYAEHFLEHLPITDAIDFLIEAHRVLRSGGRIRISTPNLDWVWVSHYDPDWPAERKITASLHVARAFHGWGHRFLWNREILGDALIATGFESITWHRHGESDDPTFAGIERHSTSADSAGHHHVLIAEATRSSRAFDDSRLNSLRELATNELGRYTQG